MTALQKLLDRITSKHLTQYQIQLYATDLLQKQHTKQMYVVVNDKNEPLWSSLSLMPPFLDTFDSKAGYTVQPVTVTIELP